MYELIVNKKFKNDVIRMKSRGQEIEKLKSVISILQNGEKLGKEYRDHKLNDTKEYKNVKACHIAPDWILIYKVDKKKSNLYLIRTGTHSEVY